MSCASLARNYAEQSIMANREVLVSPSLWNQRDLAMIMTNRATHALQEWRFGNLSSFSGAHPNRWKRMGSLQKKITRFI